MLGSPCSPCCDNCPADGKPRTDPKDEGTWVPSGTWRGVGGVTWTLEPNPGDESGETWFFYGSFSTSKKGGGATPDEQRDWGNLCNWYSNKTTAPSDTASLTTVLNKRATRLPPDGATVHVYSVLSNASVGGATVAKAYFWVTGFATNSALTTTAAAHDSAGGAVFNNSSFNEAAVNGGATFNDSSYIHSTGTVNGGATLNSGTVNGGTVNGGATFNDNSFNNSSGIVNDGAVFNGTSYNIGTVNDGAVFNDNSPNGVFGVGTVNGGATFNDSSYNGTFAVVNDGAVFNGSSSNSRGTVNGGATFNDSSLNGVFATVNDGAIFNGNSSNFRGTVNGGATFNDNSYNDTLATVNDGATFNDAACSRRTVGSFISFPCTRKFVAHPTDLPTCNGTAPSGCDSPPASCGCG